MTPPAVTATRNRGLANLHCGIRSVLVRIDPLQPRAVHARPLKLLARDDAALWLTRITLNSRARLPGVIGHVLP